MVTLNLFMDNLSAQKDEECEAFVLEVKHHRDLKCAVLSAVQWDRELLLPLNATYKKLLLKCVICDSPDETMGLITLSIESLSNDVATRCVRYALA